MTVFYWFFFLFTSSIDDIYPNKKDSDSGVGSDNGDKRLSATEVSCLNFVYLPSLHPHIFLLGNHVNATSAIKTVQPHPWHEFLTNKRLKQKSLRFFFWFSLCFLEMVVRYLIVNGQQPTNSENSVQFSASLDNNLKNKDQNWMHICFFQQTNCPKRLYYTSSSFSLVFFLWFVNLLC